MMKPSEGDFSEILSFWFEEIEPSQWFRATEELDQLTKERFGNLHRLACEGALFPWRECASGRLAEIIILDQFSRSLFRGHARAFSQDSTALVLSQEAIRVGADRELANAEQRLFMYMPFMHSESAFIHSVGIGLFRSLGDSRSLDAAQQHKDIIDRFGRYPHRNAILGRASSPEELAFLAQPGVHFRTLRAACPWRQFFLFILPFFLL